MRIRNKVFSMLLCIILVSLAGCQNQSEQIYKLYTSDPDNMLRNGDNPSTGANVANEKDAIDETQGQLTIYTRGGSSNDYYDWMIRAFNKKYPNVRISLTGPEGESATVSDLTAKISTDIMSGSAGDIIDINTLPYLQFGKNNLLEDLYPYMEKDQEFHKEDYYTNIFKAMEYDDKLWAIPTSSLYWVVRFNKTLLEENQIEVPESDSVDYKSITDIYDKIAANNDKLLISHYFNQDIFGQIEYSNYFDVKQGKANFDSLEFIDFLSEMKRIQWPSEGELRLARLNSACQDFSDKTDENDICLFLGSWYHLERNAKLFYEHPSNLTVPIPMSASNGDKPFWCADNVFSILSYSKNKELAWKFIRFCIEEKPMKVLEDRNSWQLTGMPINRNNTLNILKSVFGEINKEAVQMIDGWNSEINDVNIVSNAAPLFATINEITNEFYGGRITAEECAKKVQERTEIYLKE